LKLNYNRRGVAIIAENDLELELLERILQWNSDGDLRVAMHDALGTVSVELSHNDHWMKSGLEGITEPGES